MVGLLVRMLEGRVGPRQVIVPQPALYLLVQTASPTVLAELYWTLLKHRVRVREFTAFHFVSRLAQPDKAGISRWAEALKILQGMKYRVHPILSTVQAKHAFLGVLYQAMRANDSQTTQEIMTLLKDIHRRGNTIVIVTHEKDVADQTERQILLRDGVVTTTRQFHVQDAAN